MSTHKQHVRTRPHRSGSVNKGPTQQGHTPALASNQGCTLMSTRKYRICKAAKQEHALKAAAVPKCILMNTHKPHVSTRPHRSGSVNKGPTQQGHTSALASSQDCTLMGTRSYRICKATTQEHEREVAAIPKCILTNTHKQRVRTRPHRSGSVNWGPTQQ